MVDYAQVDMFVRIADNPEIDPVQDKVAWCMSASRSAGYARDDVRPIIAAGDHIHLDFDMFQLDQWIEVAVINDGPAAGSITLSDAALDYTIPVPIDACLLLRHFNNANPGAPLVSSTVGTKMRLFKFGPPWTTPV